MASTTAGLERVRFGIVMCFTEHDNVDVGDALHHVIERERRTVIAVENRERTRVLERRPRRRRRIECVHDDRGTARTTGHDPERRDEHGASGNAKERTDERGTVSSESAHERIVLVAAVWRECVRIDQA